MHSLCWPAQAALVLRGITDGPDGDIETGQLIGKRMFGISGELTIFQGSDHEMDGFTLGVLGLDLSFGRRNSGRVLDVVGKDEAGIVLAEAFGGRGFDFGPIPRRPALERPLDLIEQVLAGTMKVGDGRVRALENLAAPIAQRIG